jgi:hypothetical protein
LTLLGKTLIPLEQVFGSFPTVEVGSFGHVGDEVPEIRVSLARVIAFCVAVYKLASLRRENQVIVELLVLLA